MFFFLDLALLRGMLTVNPQDRFTLADISAHGWCIRWVGFPPSHFPPSSSLSLFRSLVLVLQVLLHLSCL